MLFLNCKSFSETICFTKFFSVWAFEKKRNFLLVQNIFFSQFASCKRNHNKYSLKIRRFGIQDWWNQWWIRYIYGIFKVKIDPEHSYSYTYYRSVNHESNFWNYQFFQKTNERLEKTILRALRIIFSHVSFIFWKNWEFQFFFEIYWPLGLCQFSKYKIQHIHFGDKIELILYPQARNFLTNLTLIIKYTTLFTCHKFLYQYNLTFSFSDSAMNKLEINYSLE